jgi:hypothetical protein
LLGRGNCSRRGTGNHTLLLPAIVEMVVSRNEQVT